MGRRNFVRTGHHRAVLRQRVSVRPGRRGGGRWTCDRPVVALLLECTRAGVRLTVPAAREQDVRPHLHRVHPQRRVSTTWLHRVAPLDCNSTRRRLCTVYAPTPAWLSWRWCVLSRGPFLRVFCGGGSALSAHVLLQIH